MASEKPASRPRLGRGLSSLISNPAEMASAPSEGQFQPSQPQQASSKQVVSVPTAAVAVTAPDGKPREIAVADISPNPYQPRREFDGQQIAELAQSIAQQGILQPLLVAAVEDAKGAAPFVLIAGERRLRAARMLGLASVPCVIRQASAQQMLEWALIENIQRADLNPIERANAYRQYVDRFSLSHVDAAGRLGEPRTTVSNYLRILELAQPLQDMIASGQLAFGHAKVIAGVADADLQMQLARMVVQEDLTVRKLEELAAAGAQAPAASAAAEPPARTRAPYIRDMEEQLTAAIGTRVSIHPGRAKNTGRLVIEYYNLDDFERIAISLGLKRADV